MDQRRGFHFLRAPGKKVVASRQDGLDPIDRGCARADDRRTDKVVCFATSVSTKRAHVDFVETGIVLNNGGELVDPNNSPQFDPPDLGRHC